MTTSMFIKITLSVVALTGLATAEPPNPAAKAPAKADASRPDPAAIKAEPPKPPAEVEALARNLVGSWKCTGSETAMDGSTNKLTGKITARIDLDRWWIHDVFEGKSERGGFKMVAYSTFDASSKKWRRVSIDNFGHHYVGTSDGLRDGKLVWNLDFMGTMGAGQFRDTVEPSDPKSGVKFSGVVSVDKGKSWRPVYEMTCKK
jgi:hypothetical protein